MDVSGKLNCLFMLLSGSHVKLISHLKITNMYLTDRECTFVFDDVLKHSRPSFKEKSKHFIKIRNYTRLSRSSNTALFLTIVRPYKGTSSDTIARQIKNTMQEAGNNAGLFSPHSFRSAATSKVEASGTSITTILQSASWSRTSTFKKVYLNDIQQVYPNPNNEEVVYIRAI